MSTQISIMVQRKTTHLSVSKVLVILQIKSIEKYWIFFLNVNLEIDCFKKTDQEICLENYIALQPLLGRWMKPCPKVCANPITLTMIFTNWPMHKCSLLYLHLRKKPLIYNVKIAIYNYEPWLTKSDNNCFELTFNTI